MKKEKRLRRKVYVFGNPAVEEDSLALKTAKELEKEDLGVDFIYVDPNEEIMEKDLLILDVAYGIRKVSVINNLDKLETGKKVSLHDFDIAFSLKLMKKIEMIKKIKIIAIPMNYSLEKACKEVKKII